MDISRAPHEASWGLFPTSVEVARCIVDYGFQVDYRSNLLIRIDTKFTFTDARGGVHDLDPEGPAQDLGPALTIARLEGTSGDAHTDGRLELGFSDGSSIRVPAHEDFEAWSLTGPHRLRLVSLPGGGLAEWDQQDDEPAHG